MSSGTELTTIAPDKQAVFDDCITAAPTATALSACSLAWILEHLTSSSLSELLGLGLDSAGTLFATLLEQSQEHFSLKISFLVSIIFSGDLSAVFLNRCKMYKIAKDAYVALATYKR